MLKKKVDSKLLEVAARIKEMRTIQKSVANGIDVIRIFDCLNDLRNLQESVNSTNRIKKQ